MGQRKQAVCLRPYSLTPSAEAVGRGEGGPAQALLGDGGVHASRGPLANNPVGSVTCLT